MVNVRYARSICLTSCLMQDLPGCSSFFFSGTLLRFKNYVRKQHLPPVRRDRRQGI